MAEINSIQDVAENQLCTGCGTCAGICPNNAVKMVIDEKQGIYTPKIDENLCNDCGICLKICPGYEVDFEQLNQEIFGKQPCNPLLGNFQNCYVGYASDHDIRYNSSSGGLITALLVYALEEGMIDGALVTRMKKDRPLEPESFIARTREEIIEASKSKYCPVPANIALREIVKSKEGEKFAVVGLPCHIHGIRKAEKVLQFLENKIIIKFGIFCSHTDSFLASQNFFNFLGITPKQIRKIQFRGEGWPGEFQILMPNEIIKIPFMKYCKFTHNTRIFAMRSCYNCIDMTCEMADISFGDAWLKEYSHDKYGTSLFIIRSKQSEDLIQSANIKSIIDYYPIETVKVINAQKYVLYLKKMINIQNSISTNLFTKYKLTYREKLSKIYYDWISCVLHRNPRLLRIGLIRYWYVPINIMGFLFFKKDLFEFYQESPEKPKI